MDTPSVGATDLGATHTEALKIEAIGGLDGGAWDVVAEWCTDEWAHLFPADTTETYTEMFRWSSRPEADGLPIVLVALSDGLPVGTATLVADDELPEATEPGPWLAAVYVHPEARHRGVGARLVEAIVAHARRLGFPALYCYTEHTTTADWYAAKGWSQVREASINDHRVVVMAYALAPTAH